MVTGTLGRPLFWVLFVCMSLTASMELGPGRWMDTVMKSTMESTFGIRDAGILVLVYGSGLMAILRFFAGPVVHKLSDLGLLLASSILGGLGFTMADLLPGNPGRSSWQPPYSIAASVTSGPTHAWCHSRTRAPRRGPWPWACWAVGA